MSSKSADGDILSIWTIYERPLDYPGGFVARRHAIQRGGSRPTEDFLLGESLDEVRRLLPPGLTCLGREPGDEPQIVESWI